MRSDRWYLPCIRLTSVLAFILVVSVPAQGDDAWHNIYHSLKRFFTGKPSPSPTAHHHVRRSANREKTTPSTEPAPGSAEGSPSPGAAATPRVVILPATSPSPDATPGTENSVRTPQAVVKPEPSPELGPVLRSLSEPTPLRSPAPVPSPTPGAGNTATN
jgi:hypothetical protein